MKDNFVGITKRKGGDMIYNKDTAFALYNLHNYRLYFNFTKSNYTPKEGIVGIWFGKSKNYGKEFTATGEGIRVTIKKTKAEIINKVSEEEWFLINKVKAKEEIQAILNKIDQKCINSFKKFIEQYGGQSDLIISKKESIGQITNLHTKSDNKVMKEPFIDNLPLDMAFETDIVKKVYKKPNVEFKEPIYAVRYLENSAVHEFAPEIASSINQLNDIIELMVKRLEPTLYNLATNIDTHVAVMKQIKNCFVKLNKRLDQSKLNKWL